MSKIFHFTSRLEVGTDVSDDDRVCLGMVINSMFVHDLFSSDCGRFSGPEHPALWGKSIEEANALKQLNESLTAATQAALDAGARAIQDHLGIASGDHAGLYFSDGEAARKIAEVLAEYARSEITMELVDEWIDAETPSIADVPR